MWRGQTGVMIGATPTWRHLAAVAAILAVAFAAFSGLIGEPRVSERIEALQVTISPAGENGLRITEVIDQDFGTRDRHGPEFVIPRDFGEPTDVTAASDDAPDQVATTSVFNGVRIRVGDPDKEVSGQHRYRVSYVLPEARLTSGELAVDAVGAESAIPIDNVDIRVVGFDLAETTCSAGATSDTGGCQLESEPDGGYRVQVEHLKPYRGVTVGGQITGRTEVVAPAAPALPDRRQNHRALYGVVALGLGALAAGLVHLWAVRTGSNEVSGSSAADAAFGGPPPPPPNASPAMAEVRSRNSAPESGPAGPVDHPVDAGPMSGGPPVAGRVTDAELGELVTIEFAPPSGIEPWQGALALRERVDDELVMAWFSGGVAADLLTIERDGPDTRLTPGPKYQSADPFTGQILAAMFGGRSDLTLGQYDKRFSDAWTSVRESEQKWASASGWWRSHPPKSSNGRLRGGVQKQGRSIFFFMAFLWCGFPIFGFLGGALSVFGVFSGWVGLVLAALLVPALVARIVYAPLLPGRSAAGSAYALRTESFRRFLVDSEGRHVEWAWSQGLLRQYSAWAVALGAADAWQRAMSASSVPPAEISNLTTPLLMYSMASSFSSTHTAPAPSGGGSFGGSSGGFGGGSVGGGGGGGSHGSW